jgi:hypothetical protein
MPCSCSTSIQYYLKMKASRKLLKLMIFELVKEPLEILFLGKLILQKLGLMFKEFEGIICCLYRHQRVPVLLLFHIKRDQLQFCILLEHVSKFEVLQ